MEEEKETLISNLEEKENREGVVSLSRPPVSVISLRLSRSCSRHPQQRLPLVSARVLSSLLLSALTHPHSRTPPSLTSLSVAFSSHPPCVQHSEVNNKIPLILLTLTLKSPWLLIWVQVFEHFNSCLLVLNPIKRCVDGSYSLLSSCVEVSNNNNL